MNKITLIAGLISLCGFAQATTINAPSALVGSRVLDGNNAYAWGITTVVPGGQQIDSATLTFSRIALTVPNSSGTGYLYTDLLNLNKPGVTTYIDGDKPGDYFAEHYSGANITSLGSQYFVFDEESTTTMSWSYILTSAQLVSLNAYIAAGGFSIGIDPDCHYSVGGLSFNYTTSPTPGPHGSVPDAATTAYLLGASLCWAWKLSAANWFRP